MNNFVVKVIYEHIHNESHFVIHVFFGDVGNGVFELSTPLLLDIEGLALVLLGFQVFVEESLKLLALVLLSQALLGDGREVLIHVLWNGILFFVDFG